MNPSEDDDLDIALKLAQVDMYTNNLRERARRKRVVRDYQLVSAFFASSRKEKGIRKKRTKEEKYGLYINVVFLKNIFLVVLFERDR